MLRRLFPSRLLTDNEGPSQRLRVDVGQTGFFAGREFRTFREWPIPTTESYIAKVSVPIDIILFEALIEGEDGSARIETVVGGTEGGTFSEILPILPTNTMSEKPQPPYAAQVNIAAGGTHSGGTILDIIRVKTSGNSNFGGSVGADFGAERGISANTYYYRFTFDAFVGIFKARWEERV